MRRELQERGICPRVRAERDLERRSVRNFDECINAPLFDRNGFCSFFTSSIGDIDG
jgi:hypothetical protein